MQNAKASPSARVSAAQTILDRGWGKAPQAIEATMRKDMTIEEIDRRLEEARAVGLGRG